MPQNKILTDDQRSLVIELSNAGKTKKQIAAITGVSQKSIQTIRHCYNLAINWKTEELQNYTKGNRRMLSWVMKYIQPEAQKSEAPDSQNTVASNWSYATALFRRLDDLNVILMFATGHYPGIGRDVVDPDTLTVVEEHLIEMVAIMHELGLREAYKEHVVSSGAFQTARCVELIELNDPDEA